MGLPRAACVDSRLHWGASCMCKVIIFHGFDYLEVRLENSRREEAGAGAAGRGAPGGRELWREKQVSG